MLQSIRERSQGVFAWIILILICVPFALWGVQNYFGGGVEPPIAVVGEQEIFQRDVMAAYEQNKQRLGAAANQIPEETLKRMTLDNLVNEAVVRQAIDAQSLVVPDAVVRQYIQSMPSFQTDGRFDKEKYQLILSSQNLSSPELTRRVRQSLITEQYSRSIAGSGFVTDTEMQYFQTLQQQKRLIEYVKINTDAAALDISDEQINAYYQAHESDFQNPEQMSVEYIELSLDALAQQVAVDDEALQVFYEEQKDSLTIPERRKVSHILVNAEETAAQVKARLDAGENFADLARELSEDKVSAQSGGDLGLMRAGDMEPEFETAALALSAGEISVPIKTAFGYHIIQVTELELEQVQPFESVAAELKQQYQRNQAENTFYELGEKLAEASYENPDSLEPAAEATGLAVQKTALFTATQGPSVAAEAKVRQAAFGGEVLSGNNSEPIELAEDRILVLRKLEHQPATLQPLEAVKDAVLQAVRHETAVKQTEARSKVLLNALKQGQAMSDLAIAENLKLEQPEALGRTGSGLPQQLVQAVFAASKPENGQAVHFAVPLRSGEQALVSLKSIQTDKVAQSTDEREAMKKQLVQTLGYGEYGALVAQWREQTDIEVNTERAGSE